MLSVSAIFTAMTAHVAECGVSPAKHDQLSQKLRSSLLALKHFEQCYVLARWIRNIFMDIINRPSRRASHHAQKREGNHDLDKRVVGQSATPESLLQHLRLPAGTNMPGSTIVSSYAVGEPTQQSHTTGTEASTVYMYDSSSYDPSASPTGTSAVMDTIVPNLITNKFLPSPHEMSGMNNMIDFPWPSSLEYQSLHFLADLGLSGCSNYD
jgi:hypothetical protein